MRVPRGGRNRSCAGTWCKPDMDPIYQSQCEQSLLYTIYPQLVARAAPYIGDLVRDTTSQMLRKHSSGDGTKRSARRIRCPWPWHGIELERLRLPHLSGHSAISHVLVWQRRESQPHKDRTYQVDWQRGRCANDVDGKTIPYSTSLWLARSWPVMRRMSLM